MIDIHNHVIYKFDDGPQSLDESMEMLKIAEDQGITDIFATSHFSEMIHNLTENDYFEKLEILRAETSKQHIDVQIYPGGEIFFHHFMEDTVKKTRIGTMGEWGLYILLEFPLYLMPNGVGDTLFNLSTEGFVPILAHPERYSATINTPEKILDFIKYGALLQVNVGSVLGEFGKSCQKVALWLLENQYVHFLGSDAHRAKGRTFKLAQAAKFLENHLESEYIQDLVEYNPRKIINSEKIEPLQLPETQEVNGFINRVRKKLKFI